MCVCVFVCVCVCVCVFTNLDPHMCAAQLSRTARQSQKYEIFPTKWRGNPATTKHKDSTRQKLDWYGMANKTWKICLM